MNILITGSTGLAEELAAVYSGHTVTMASKSGGYDIMKVAEWGSEFLDYDLIFNCAYDGLGQVLVLDYFYQNWFNNPNKTIVTIGSKVISQPRIEVERDKEYWPYREHKQILQYIHDARWPSAVCDLKIINPGVFDSAMVAHLDVPKISLFDLAIRIKQAAGDPLVKRLDLWL
jgi:hypothetical protein